MKHELLKMDEGDVAELDETLPEEVEVAEPDWVRVGSQEAGYNQAVRTERASGGTFGELLERTSTDEENMSRRFRSRHLRFRDAVTDGAASIVELVRWFVRSGMSARAAQEAAAGREPRER
jgi:hypothetical protein